MWKGTPNGNGVVGIDHLILRHDRREMEMEMEMRTLTISEIHTVETEMMRLIDKICRQEGITYYLSAGSALGAIRHQGPIPWDSDGDIVVPIDHYSRFRRAVGALLPSPFKIYYFDTEDNYTPLFMRVGIDGFSHKTLHVDVFPIVGAPDRKRDQTRLVRLANVLTKIHYCKEATPDYVLDKSRMMIIRAIRMPLMWCRSEKIEELFTRLCQKYPLDKVKYVFNPCTSYVSKAVVPKDFYGDPAYVRYAGHFLPVPGAYEDYLRHFYGDYMQFPPVEQRDRGEGFTLDIPSAIYAKIVEFL